MKVLLNIDWENENEITLASLRWSRQDLSTTKELIFSDDRKKDRELIKKHVEALDLIIKYYSLET